MFGARSDTSANTIAFMIMTAAVHPKAQAEVQAQADSVIGRDRLPTFDDESLLPLVTAFISKFIDGVRNTASVRELTLISQGDYVIPAGETVIGNHWDIARDPDVFPDPEEFIPNRWFDKSGKLKEDITSFNFGFG
ncbi:uncharacterized protein PHACADRAFT_214820 [Phanerochaete carnosa HHB-10118-sp]|uniref:Cytochrome P450 n=1 Tax=Phanerochaete carnosa (strain HHB-10118-sp) TaxID=650164 RepID=K5VPA5_PHACS|nr:uncharacterized protein PHACADRAFT_214820 [Phanerochaete carnosa HHB-10118-sp]EKM48394.1 hypothetical protein PHACADRAFT_214820 [Phanerochaete carnosa HHB-10118-sp]